MRRQLWLAGSGLALFPSPVSAKEAASVAIPFELVGDQFEHAWFYNRFRIDRLGDSYLITFCLVTEAAGSATVNAVVLSNSDVLHNKVRTLDYLNQLSEIKTTGNFSITFSAPPDRVYPVNHMNLGRVDNMAEIGFYRFSVNSLVERMRSAQSGQKEAKVQALNCYPVVMFRSNIETQLALLKQLYSS